MDNDATTLYLNQEDVDETMRGHLVLAALVLCVGISSAQFQPVDPQWDGFHQREDITSAGQLDGAKRVLRFVQVSDAHILDDDAPYPVRQTPLDALGPPFESAQRPQEEYTDEVLDAMIRQINAAHEGDALDFVVSTGDNIDNQLENELMRFLDNLRGTWTTTGPISGLPCVPDGQSTSVEDDANDETDDCTHLPEGFENTPLAPGLPWFSAFGNHDGLIQGNVPLEPGFNDVAAEHGRFFLQHSQYVQMHFADAKMCISGVSTGSVQDDFGHGFGFAGARLCDDDPDNDGYYAFSSRGVRFIVLDTMNDDFVAANGHLADAPAPQQVVGNDVLGGYHDGAIDPAQYAWLMDEVAANKDSLVVVMSHHTVNSMFSKTVEECGQDMCLDDALAEAGYRTGPELVEALSAYPHVVAWIGGHTHQHKVEPKGFWNIETSSLIDLPQESRVIEVWVTADGKKGFLALQRLGHDFEASRELAASDPHADPDAAGEVEDQDVLLWFDIPEGVGLVQQASVPRFLVATPVVPEARVGEETTLRMQVHDSRFGHPVDGLEIQVSVHRADAEAATGVAFLMEGKMAALGGGEYALNLTPESDHVHYARFAITDPTGTYPDVHRSASIDVQGDAAEAPSAKKSPAPAALLVILAAFALRRR